MYNVLFVDSDESMRTALLEYFGGRYASAAACGAADALDIMERGGFHLAVCGISATDVSAADFLREVRRLYPKTKRALLTSLNINGYIAFARQNSIGTVIPKTVPFNFEEMGLILEGVLTGEVFGISRYLNREECVIMGEYCVKSSSEASAVKDTVVSELEKKLKTAADTGLVLDEILANAVCHAPAKPPAQMSTGVRFGEAELGPSEYVYVRVGYDSEKYAVSVLDTQGRLTKDTVLDRMERHISGDGLTDGGGRGLYMSRLFSDRVFINIERNKRTEIIIINYFDPKRRGYKPLCINEISWSDCRLSSSRA